MITALFVAKHRTELAIFSLGAATLSLKGCILTYIIRRSNSSKMQYPE